MCNSEVEAISRSVEFSDLYIWFQVSVTLETSETINRRFVHPSRRNSPTHTKVQIQWRFFYYIVFFLPLTLSTGPKRSPWSGCRPYSDELSVFDSHGWSNVVYNTSCFCAMDSSFWVPNYSKGCALEQVLLPNTQNGTSNAKDHSLFQSQVFKLFKVKYTSGSVWFYRYEHPLLIREREKCEWVLPITVHAPPPRTSSAAQNRGDKLFGLEPSWVRS